VTVTLEDNIAALLERTIPCFQRQRVLYVLIGAWVLVAWGRPRATNDLDFLVLVNESDIERLSRRLIDAGLQLDETWHQWNPMLRGLQLRFQFQGVPVDLLFPRDLHDQQIFLRKRKKRMNGHYYWVVSLEDFILQKLKVGRPRDFEDALSVVDRFQEVLDRTYLEHWANELRVREELSYILGS
jgi:predicted nucleotidyltransferase